MRTADLVNCCQFVVAKRQVPRVQVVLQLVYPLGTDQHRGYDFLMQ